MEKKIIVITGANGGVGGMLAVGLAQKGYHIVCVNRGTPTEETTEQTIKAAGGSASSEICDMMDVEGVKKVGQKIMDEFGRIDVWINNVGVNNHNAIGRTWELEPENWWQEISLNFFTAYIGTTTAINLMKPVDKGYIINLGGGGVQKVKPYGSAYGSAKTAIVKFTETVNVEFEAEKMGLKIFAINPGFIRNKRTEKLVDSDVCKEFMPRLENTLKHGTMSDIKDSVDLVDALISGRADSLSGRYFLADDRNIEEVIANSEKIIEQKKYLLILNE